MRQTQPPFSTRTHEQDEREHGCVLDTCVGMILRSRYCNEHGIQTQTSDQHVRQMIEHEALGCVRTRTICASLLASPSRARSPPRVTSARRVEGRLIQNLDESKKTRYQIQNPESESRLRVRIPDSKPEKKEKRIQTPGKTRVGIQTPERAVNERCLSLQQTPNSRADSKL